MNRLVTAVMLAACAMSGVRAQEAQVRAQEAQQAQPVQVFACTLARDKTMEDVMALARAYREAWPSFDPGAEDGAFLWMPLRESSPYDYIVGFISASLTDMVSDLESYYGSGQGEQLDQQFTGTGSCDSLIVFSEQLKDGSFGQTADDEPDAVVETFVCNFREGAGMAEVEAAEAHWRQQVAAIGSEAIADLEVYRWLPFRGNSGNADFMWVGNWPDLATWAEGSEAYRGSQQGQAADDRLNAVSRCANGLWSGFWIVPPDAGPTAE